MRLKAFCRAPRGILSCAPGHFIVCPEAHEQLKSTNDRVATKHMQPIAWNVSVIMGDRGTKFNEYLLPLPA